MPNLLVIPAVVMTAQAINAPIKAKGSYYMDKGA